MNCRSGQLGFESPRAVRGHANEVSVISEDAGCLPAVAQRDMRRAQNCARSIGPRWGDQVKREPRSPFQSTRMAVAPPAETGSCSASRN